MDVRIFSISNMCMVMSNNIDTSKNHNISEDIRDLDAQIKDLNHILKSSKSKQLDENQLLELAYLQNQIAEKRTLLDNIYEKKGIFHYWYVKMPTQVLNVGSIRDNQRFINDTVRTLSSPMCPICSNGLMMYNLSSEPINGKVRWFCSNKSCTFKIWAEPATGSILMDGINKALKENVGELGKGRWESLSEEEKDELIDSHLSKAILYRNLSFLMILICLVEVCFQMWWGVSLLFSLTLLVSAISIKWGYRAWQIKTGSVFMEYSPFLDWIRTADKYYSVDWVDNVTDEVNKS